MIGFGTNRKQKISRPIPYRGIGGNQKARRMNFVPFDCRKAQNRYKPLARWVNGQREVGFPISQR